MRSNVSANVSVTPTTRAQVVTRRTYNRPLSEDDKVLKGANYKPADLSNLIKIRNSRLEADV